MSCLKDGKQHATLHHSVKLPLVLRMSSAISLKGLSVKAIQDCYTRTGLLHTYSVATHVQHCYTHTGLPHTYRIAAHVQDCYTRTALLHTYRIATHVQHCYTRKDCYYNNIYKPIRISPYTVSTNTFKIKRRST